MSNRLVRGRSLRAALHDAPDKVEFRIANPNGSKLFIGSQGEREFRSDRLCSIHERSKGIPYAAEQNQPPYAAQGISALICNGHPERSSQSHQLANDGILSRIVEALFERLRPEQQVLGQRLKRETCCSLWEYPPE